MKKLFCEKHRGMSGSSICLNMLLITVRLPIYLNVSIAVSHVPSAAPLSRLPHRQIIIYMSIFLPMNLISFTYSYEAYLRGLDTQYNVLQWLVEPADCSCCFGVPFALDTVFGTINVKSTITSIASVRMHPSNVQVRVAISASTGLRRPMKRVLMPTRSPGHKGVFYMSQCAFAYHKKCQIASHMSFPFLSSMKISMWHSGTAQGRDEQVVI
ncbi:hypothetical protein T08_3609 [Trichinella sp. T8]|nr:hypothetical protein T08_3609 [Trichinella sp. T8]